MNINNADSFILKLLISVVLVSCATSVPNQSNRRSISGVSSLSDQSCFDLAKGFINSNHNILKFNELDAVAERGIALSRLALSGDINDHTRALLSIETTTFAKEYRNVPDNLGRLFAEVIETDDKEVVYFFNEVSKNLIKLHEIGSDLKTESIIHHAANTIKAMRNGKLKGGSVQADMMLEIFMSDTTLEKNLLHKLRPDIFPEVE
ncbi:hypothetical protein A9Q84_17615 [Halobacteriovorax marinus]|uniref:Uncharacterized protein n=1 Tax=Halobacteriovorax marinus TaxID=97084 RepID=A0A1Y5F901_9BACT|nr:hypothetical protein A9Q84_17615 [Halobacteriovorax marinus]